MEKNFWQMNIGGGEPKFVSKQRKENHMVWGAGSAAEQLPSMCESGLSPQCFAERGKERGT